MSYLGVPPFGQTVRTTTSQTANGTQDTFYPTGGYIVGYLDVYYNGVKVVENSDFTAGDGTSVVFNTAPTSNATIEMVSYGPISFVDAVARSGDTMSGTLNVLDVIPAANNTYSLGNNTNRFANLYLSGNTIILGDSTISANATSVSFANSTGGAIGIALSNTGVVANTYGDANNIPVVIVDAQGRVSNVSLANTLTTHATTYSNAVSYAATIAGTAYTNAVSTASTDATTKAGTAYTNAVSYADTKAAAAYANVFNGGTFTGNVVFTSNVTANTVRLNGSMQIDGDLIVSGNTVTMNVTSLAVEDNMIYLNSSSNVANPDLGFAGNYNDGTYRHAGIFRDATDGVWKFFHQYEPEPDASAYIDTSNNTFAFANVQANTFIGAGSFSTISANGLVTLTDSLSLGNSTVNTAITSTSINTNGTITANTIVVGNVEQTQTNLNVDPAGTAFLNALIYG